MMNIKVQSSKTVRPANGNGGGGVLPAVPKAVPLTVFDKVTYDKHISGIHLFRPPTPPNAVLEAGLAIALAEHREWAGRLGVGADGERAILLNDAGARFVEAAAAAVDMPLPLFLEPAPEIRSLHPSGDGAEELLLLQVTRFACGSVAVGFTMHHAVGDGRAMCNFLLAWGQATRGGAAIIGGRPAPVHDRTSLFVRRCPPRVEFDHRGAEFKRPHHLQGGENNNTKAGENETVVVRRMRFSQEFISKLKSSATAGAAAPPRRNHRCSTVLCVAAHLWRCITKARGGLDGHEVTTLRVAVDGRARMRRPRVPDGYTGNVVLLARPAIPAGELLAAPFRQIVGLISRELARVDDAYFRSFIDFASSGAVEEERLVPMDDAEETVYSPDVEVDSLLDIPFNDLDFGGGRSFFFIPSYLPVEGSVFVVRSFRGDNSVDAYVPLFRRDMDRFNKCCYELPMADARL